MNSFRELSPKISDNLKIIQAGLDRIVYINNETEEDIKLIKQGWEYAKKAIQNDEYQLIILDEANIAIDLGILDVDEVLEVLKNKPEEMEIVLTGRNAHPKVIEIAHLVSEIKPIKHYWDTGIAARKGIESRYKQGFSESTWATQKMKFGIMSQLIDDSRLVSIEVIPLHDFGERLYSQRISL